MAEPPDVRIGDRERERAQTRLEDAYGQGALTLDEFKERLEVALRARTRGQLEPLLTDLPEASDASDVEPSAAPEPRRPNRMRRVGIVAVIAGIVVFFGTLVRGADAVNLFGSTVYNVPVDRTDEAVDEVRILSLFGSIEVVLPDEAVAQNNVTAIMGSSECDSVCTTTSDRVHDVRVDGLSLFGSVQIRGG
ncbi:MAG: DUF1707 domain-containing protein [Jiangellaceae bacterium]